MTEQARPIGTEDSDLVAQEATAAPRASTGVPAVDAVLDDVERVQALPLEEHLPAFERAHESLRAALDATSADQASGEPDEPA